ncbi:MAG: hypothetical protein WBK19_16385 [Azonexus sp.]
MSYAVRKDGQGWRAVNGPDDVWQDEEFSLSQPIPPALTQEQVVAAYSAAVQFHLDTAARDAGYDNINTAVSYAEEPAVVKFQGEGAAFRAWRSLCWAYCYAQLAAVEAQEREQPTIEALIAELPSLVLP